MRLIVFPRQVLVTLATLLFTSGCLTPQDAVRDDSRQMSPNPTATPVTTGSNGDPRFHLAFTAGAMTQEIRYLSGNESRWEVESVATHPSSVGPERGLAFSPRGVNLLYGLVGTAGYVIAEKAGFAFATVNATFGLQNLNTFYASAAYDGRNLRYLVTGVGYGIFANRGNEPATTETVNAGIWTVPHTDLSLAPISQTRYAAAALQPLAPPNPNHRRVLLSFDEDGAAPTVETVETCIHGGRVGNVVADSKLVGTVHLLYICYALNGDGVLKHVIRTANATVSSTIVSDAASVRPHLVAGADGALHAVYVNRSGDVLYLHRPPSGPWSGGEVVVSGTVGDHVPQLALNEGTPYLFASQRQPSDTSVIIFTKREASGWETAREIADTESQSQDPLFRGIAVEP